MEINDRIRGRGMRADDLGSIIEIKGKMALIKFDGKPNPIWKPLKKIDLIGESLFDMIELTLRF